MNPDVLVLPLEMPLREAVHRLLKNDCSLAPVVNAAGRCIGAFSATNYLRSRRNATT